MKDWGFLSLRTRWVGFVRLLPEALDDLVEYREIKMGILQMLCMQSGYDFSVAKEEYSSCEQSKKGR